MNRHELQTVNFAGAELDCVHDERDGEVYVSLRRVCESLGIDHSSQFRKLREYHWATIVNLTMVAGDGRARELSMINLDTLGMWLATISPGRVSDEARPKVILYQAECVRVLRRHFFGESKRQAEPTNRNLAALANINQQLATIAGDHEQRLAELEQKVERKALPPAAEVDVDDLRTRFEGAMRNAFHESGHLDGLTSPERGAFYHNVNSTLKNVIMCGRSRKNWGVDHYEAAAGWLRQRYGIDLSWIFKVAQTAA